jgi:hypothetical protein
MTDPVNHSPHCRKTIKSGGKQMKIPRSKLSIAAITALLVAGMGMTLLPVYANGPPPAVDPPFVGVTLAPGDFINVDKTVYVPEFPPKLDICLVVDLSGSYFDDLDNIKLQMPVVWELVKAEVTDVRWCLTSFVDFPFLDWGGDLHGDYAYSLDQDLTPDKTTWTSAVNAMATRWGADEPESQYEALIEMAAGLGNDVPPAGPSLGDVPAGLNPDWRADATKIVILTTDAPFHTFDDSNCSGTDSGDLSDCPFGYPGPTAADATDALVDAGIKFIGLMAPGAGAELADLALATGGSVQLTDATSSDIAAAILAALEELDFDITGTPEDCDPLDISLDPAAIEDVMGPAFVEFDELIAAPADLTDVEEICCEVVFRADDTEIGVQEVCVEVKRTVAIDIKPGNFPNSINLKKAKGVIPVAILGSDVFDVMDVDVTTLTFGATGFEQVPAHDLTVGAVYFVHLQDVNGDGFMDLVSHYVSGGTGIVSGDTEAFISGKTFDGINFMGSDSVRTLH